ncbi:MAG: pyridoxamine 5'-phosphate oxidase family protein [Anaerolineales bacterium]
MEPIVSRPDMPGYGIVGEKEGAGLLPWSFVEERMAKAHNYWIGTVTPDGRPHAAPVWGLWHDGAFYFSTGSNSRKGRNLAARPLVSVHSESGDEAVMFEGQVENVSDKALLKALDKAYKEKYGLPMQGPGIIFRLKPDRAFAWREKDFPESATRWIFE